MFLNQISCTNEGANSAESPWTCFDSVINFHLRPSEAEAGPDGALDDYLMSSLAFKSFLHIKPLFYPGAGPYLPKCWYRVARVGASNKFITTEVVMVLFFVVAFVSYKSSCIRQKHFALGSSP
jgi:hypothetical protein